MAFPASSLSIASDHLVDASEAELRHPFPDFLGDHLEVVHDVLRFAGELLAKHGILRRDANRAGIQMADAHHDAAGDDQRRRCKAKLFAAKQGGNDDVAAGLQLAVRLNDDAAAQVVHHEHLMGFRQTKFPRNAGVLDAGDRRRAGTAAVTGDQNDVRMRLGDAGRDRSDTDFRNQLHADARAWIRVLQVVDQLRQILDRIDIVVRRR